MFRLSTDTPMTRELLAEFLEKHRREVNNRYKKLDEAYMSDHEILHYQAKPKYKPDNRIVANFPKYIVDTTNGFFIGNPIKIVADDVTVSDYVEYLNRYNDQDDLDAELSKRCSIFGHGFEMYCTDEDSELRVVNFSPTEAFMIYDDSVFTRPLYFVRRYTDNDNIEWGSIADSYGVRHFKITGGVKWTDEDWNPHHFPGVPAVEYVENEERQGVFEPVLTMVNAYNKALSEKANDVDYFADAYLKILGVQLGKDELQYIRDNRILNVYGADTEKIEADFMDRPSNDAAQEHLLDRLERLIFHIGQTANASDENFGTNSGIAMLYKIWSTSNRGKNKQRKFESGMTRRYRLLFGHPASKVPADSWVQLRYQFTPNIPSNVLEETQIAANVEGIVSRETQLKTLSIVDNVKDELERIEKEEEAGQESVVERMMFTPAAQTEAADGGIDEQP